MGNTQAENDFLHRHSDILDEKLKYDVYLIRGKGIIHHFLVLQEEGGKGCFRVELMQQWMGKAIFLYSDFKGTLKIK